MYVPATYTGGSCKSLILRNGILYNDKMVVYLKLNSSNFSACSFTVDDRGIMRLIGVKNQVNKYYMSDFEEVVIYNLQVVNKYLLTFSNMIFNSTYSWDNTLTNNRNWQFSLTASILQITHIKNLSLSIKHNLANLAFSPSSIYESTAGPSPSPNNNSDLPANSNLREYPFIMTASLQGML